MSSKPVLKLDWCSHEAAKYAVEKWHYSHCMPKSKLAKIGVWEDGKFIGVVIYGVGATAELVKQYGLKPVEGCELVRVALSNHRSQVSRILSISFAFLKKAMKGLRIIVSFADPERGHHGGIYQAGGWIFAGNSAASQEYIVNGKRWHGRAFRASKPAHLTTKQTLEMMDPNYKVIMGSSKHRYLMPLDDEMRKRIAPLAKPYPKRIRAGSETLDTPVIHTGEGGSIPTPALHTYAIKKHGNHTETQ